MSVFVATAATPYLPLTRPTLDEETIAGVVDVLRSGWITSGPNVKALEAKLSEYCGGRPVRVFNSGTCTMEIALRIAGVGPGHEVITTPLSWVATSHVILAVGARPVFVDIDPVTRNIDVNRIEAAITPATRAIMPVDLAGLPVDRAPLYAIAKKHHLRVVEDAAQSYGTTWNGKRIGAIGDLVSFSFHPNKNVTTIEGGALVMNTEVEAKLAEQYRLQGVVRSGKRRELARAYFELFARPAVRALGWGLPVADFQQTNWHMFQVVLPEARLTIKRAEVMAKLHAAGIGTGVHYPAIHLFAVYRRLGWKDGDFPLAEAICRSILTLPLFPTMTRADAERVVDTLAEIVSAHLLP
ncbi:MAG: DegT/DnrJ/EryC1/StrS aminotransferase family protein [Verrucomicrobia bacterium]|nr:DegT/DnrJ/EryC1/StrS aminotransferase family protein [Verrucomicrobiota bacterium]